MTTAMDRIAVARKPEAGMLRGQLRARAMSVTVDRGDFQVRFPNVEWMMDDSDDLTALDRIADALDRIATALEAQAKASDFLNAALLPEQPMGDVPSVPEWRVDRDGGFIVLDGGGGRGEYAEASWRPATDAEAEAIRARIRPTERRTR